MTLNALAVPAKESYLQFDAERLCPLCQSSEQVVLSRRMQFELDCITVICKQCGFCFVSPTPTREAYNRFYREAYAWYYRKIHSDRSQGRVVESAWQKARLDWIESYGLLAGKQVLEIGPGSGRFLQLAAGRGACCAAIEPSSAFREQLAGKGIRIVSDFLENADESMQFDLVMGFQVLEHFHDPVAAMRKIRSLLVPDGILVCDVPSIWKPFRSLDRYFLRYVHLSYFSPSTLRRLLVRHGFAIQFLDEGGHSIHAPQPIFVIAKAVDAAATFPESDVEDWRVLLSHLQRYRQLYPWLHGPRIQGRIFLRSLRGVLARGVVGRIYRYLKKRGGVA